MKVEDKYILLESWESIEKVVHELNKSLESNKLANVIIASQDEKNDIEIAKPINELLIEKNGLACFYECDSIKPVNDLGLDCVVALPTKHEAIEAVMMNILENEFLSQGN